MVQYIGVHNKIVSDYRFMGSKYCYSNDKEEEISVRGHKKLGKYPDIGGKCNKYDRGLHRGIRK